MSSLRCPTWGRPSCPICCWSIAIITACGGAGTAAPPPSPVQGEAREATLGRRFAPDLIATLNDLAAAQDDYHRNHGTYAVALSSLPGRLPQRAPIMLAILRADSAGWRALAAHDSVPWLACGIREGVAPGVLPEDTVSGVVGCWDNLTQQARAGTSRLDSLSASTATEQIPPVERCPPIRLDRSALAAMLPPESALLQFVVDTDGRAVVDNRFALIKSTSPTASLAAIGTVQLCRFRPARLNGQRVPVLVQMPVHFGP